MYYYNMLCIKQYFYIILFSILISYITTRMISSSYDFNGIIKQISNKDLKISLIMGIIGFIIHLVLRNTLIHPDCNDTIVK